MKPWHWIAIGALAGLLIVVCVATMLFLLIV